MILIISIIVLGILCIILGFAFYKKNCAYQILRNKIHNTENSNLQIPLKVKPEEFEQFFANSLDMMCIADIQGYFQILNPEWEQTLGYSLSELIGRQFIEFVHPDDVEKTIEATQKLANNQSVQNFENRYRHKDGSYRWIEWRSYPAKDKIYAAAHNITDRKLAQEALSKSEQKYRLLFKNMSSGFAFHEMIFDPYGNPIDFRYIDANIKYMEIWGVDNSLIGRTAFEVFPYAEKQWVDIAWKVITTNQPQKSIFKMLTTNRHIEVIEYRIDSTHFAAIFNDITDHVENENFLKENETRLSGMLENMPVAMGVTDINGKIKFNNKKIFEIFGYDPEEVSTIDKWMNLAYPNEDYRNQVKSNWQNDIKIALDSQTKYSPARIYLIQNKSGNTIDVEISFAIIEDELYVIFNDVTDKIKAINELRSSEQKFSNIFNMSPDMVGITQQSDGKILTGNSQFSVITGYSSEEYLDKSTLELGLWANPLDRQLVLDALKTVGEILNLEIEMKIKNGSILTCLFSARPIDFNNEACLLFVVHDISDRIAAEEKIRKSEARLQRAQTIGRIGYAEQNLGENTYWASAEGMSIYGFPPVEGFIEIDKITACIPDYNTISDKFFQQMEQGKNQDIEFVLNPADGSPQRYIHAVTNFERDKDGNPTKILSIFQDITERKLAEIGLNEARKFKDALIESIPGLAYIYDQDARLVQWNKKHLEITGYSEEELYGKNIYDFFNASDPDSLIIKSSAEKLKNEDFSDIEAYLTKKNGEKILFYFNTVATIIDGKYYFAGIGLDITERKRYIEALQKRVLALTKPLDDPEGVKFTDLFDIEELQKVQDTFANATGVASIITYPDGTPITQPSNFCSLCNLICGTEKGRANCFKSDAALGKQNLNGPIIQPCLSGGLWDAGAGITLGGKHMANWLIGQVRNDIQDDNKFFKYADKIGADREQFKQALKEVRSMSKEQFEKISQALFVLANQLSLKAYQNVQLARFIAEQNKAEEALRKSEAQFRGITHNIPGMVFQFYARKNGEIGFYYVSDSSMEYIGIDNTHLEGIFERFANGIVEEERDRFISSVQSAISAVTMWEFEGQYMKPDGKKIYLRGLSQPRQLKDEIVFDGLLLDVTERKEAELEIKKLNLELEERVLKRTEQLLQANKDLEAFAYSVSHDLRAPLRHVDGFVKLLYSNITNPPDIVNAYYEKINKSSKRMSSMIDDLLSFSRLGRKEINVTPANLNTLINEIIDQIKPDTVQRNIQWDIKPLPIIRADRNLLKIAFENLISNAIKYTSKKKDARIEIGSNLENDNYYTIYIKDNGAGFNMDYYDKLFGVFHRLHSSDEFEGTGIGLANVKQIIIKHNGSIRAEAKVNEGASFFVTLPK
jgi:PAS domain S-box-containing protein